MKKILESLKNLDSDKKILVFTDTETTGIEYDDRILQAAYAVFIFEEMKLLKDFEEKGENFIKENINKYFLKYKYKEEFILPPTKIKPEAAMIHGIWYDDLKKAEPWENSSIKKDLEFLNSINSYFIAHNALFDYEMYSRENLKWNKSNVIDTLKLAKHTFKDSKKHSLQYLRYSFDYDKKHLKEDIKIFNQEKIVPHTALSDIIVLYTFFKDILIRNKFNFKKIKEISQKPLLLNNVNFGRVFDKEISFEKAMVSSYEQYGRTKKGYEYFIWAFNNMDLEFDTKYTIVYHLVKNIINGNINFNRVNIQFEKDFKKIVSFLYLFIPDLFIEFNRKILKNEVSLKDWDKNIDIIKRNFEKKIEHTTDMLEKASLKRKLLEIIFFEENNNPLKKKTSNEY